MASIEHANFPSLDDDVRQALKQWHGDSSAASPLAALYLFRQTQREGYSTPRQITNQVLLKALALLRQTDEAAARLLQMRYLDLLPVAQVANQLNIAESTLFTAQRTAIQRLTASLHDLEQEATLTQKTLLDKRLPSASYVKLVGIDAYLDQLAAVLATPEPPWVISIEGIGGVGKTAMADALIRRLIQQGTFDEVGWVSAQPHRLNLGGALTPVAGAALTAEILIEKLAKQLLPEVTQQAVHSTEGWWTLLQARMKAFSHLIVIDNLETLNDVESLLPTLQQLTNPTKFILTSRASFYSEANLFHFRVPELTQPAALQLIRQEATLRNLPVFASCPDSELQPIIDTVGGNPLAIRLIVGQSHIHPLHVILADLRHARSQTVETFYNYLYRWAWDNLTPLEQQALLVMPLANPTGDDLEYLAEVGDFEVGVLRMAMNRLVMLNLVDSRGGLHERRYSIHSLTRTFLQEQVAKWLS